MDSFDATFDHLRVQFGPELDDMPITVSAVHQLRDIDDIAHAFGLLLFAIAMLEARAIRLEDRLDAAGRLLERPDRPKNFIAKTGDD